MHIETCSLSLLIFLPAIVAIMRYLTLTGKHAKSFKKCCAEPYAFGCSLVPANVSALPRASVEP